MINLLLGAPGGGKSYEAVVYHVLPALQRGRRVVTNLPLNVEAFAALDPTYPALLDVRRQAPGEGRPFASVEDYADPWRHADGFGPLYIVDECHYVLPKGQTPRVVEEWYSMHRHHNVDVLLITQSYGKISQAVRDLVQIVYRVRKNVALGSTSTYTRKVQDGLRGEVVNTSVRRYEAKYFGLYRSHTQGTAAAELNAGDVRPLWMHWSFLGAAACVVVGVGLVFAFDVRLPWSSAPQVQAKAKAPPPGPDLLEVARASVPSSTVATLTEPAVLQPVTQAAEEAEAREPFARLGIHLLGVIEAGSRRRWAFALSQNGQLQAHVTDVDLIEAGYTWEGFGPCAGVLRHGTVRRQIVCDSPQVSIGIAGRASGG